MPLSTRCTGSESQAFRSVGLLTTIDSRRRTNDMVHRPSRTRLHTIAHPWHSPAYRIEKKPPSWKRNSAQQNEYFDDGPLWTLCQCFRFILNSVRISSVMENQLR